MYKLYAQIFFLQICFILLGLFYIQLMITKITFYSNAMVYHIFYFTHILSLVSYPCVVCTVCSVNYTSFAVPSKIVNVVDLRQRISIYSHIVLKVNREVGTREQRSREKQEHTGKHWLRLKEVVAEIQGKLPKECVKDLLTCFAPTFLNTSFNPCQTCFINIGSRVVNLVVVSLSKQTKWWLCC